MGDVIVDDGYVEPLGAEGVKVSYIEALPLTLLASGLANDALLRKTWFQ